MPEPVKPLLFDATGHEVLTKAVLELLATYPGLNGREILFEELGKESGLAFFAGAQALVITERRTITGRILQTCQYPFYIYYRTTSTQERQKISVQTFLDSLGKWLCGEPAEVNGEYIRLLKFPELTQGRKITRITRENSAGTEPTEEGVQDWVLPATVEYSNTIEPL